MCNYEVSIENDEWKPISKISTPILKNIIITDDLLNDSFQKDDSGNWIYKGQGYTCLIRKRNNIIGW